ncbi:TniQ family protein [Aureimonas ureilytica]|uniref:TniQ family protein n=1 Tax=Aureimonas ureilytica TaxID=401562 RepID=UPI0003A94B4D|nr:TniQ family protein [Aureimonas ureilytica]
MKRLPLRPRPRPGESPTSLLCRLAARSGRQQMKAFAQWVGVDLADVASGRSNAQLACLSGLPIEEINEYSAHPLGEETVTYRGRELVLRHDWLAPGGRSLGGSYCPICLSDDLADTCEDAGPVEQRAYWRSHWDVSTIRSCNRHGILLRHRCPNEACAAPVRLMGASIHRCFECDADLRMGPTLTLPEAHGRFQAYAHGRIGLGPAFSVRWLDEFYPYQAEELCWRLGSASSRTSQSHNDHAKQDPIGFQVACDEGLAICEGGEVAIDAILDRMVDEADSRAAGPSAAYGPFYRWLDNKRVHESPPVTLLRAIVTRHALREIPFMERDQLFGEEVRGNAYTSVRSASLRIPLQYKSFVRTALEHGLMDDRDVRLRRFRLDRLQDLVRARRERPVWLKEFLDTFGIGRVSFNDLVRTERVKVLRGASRTSSGVPRDDYDRLLDRIGMNKQPTAIEFEHTTLGDEHVRRAQVLQGLIDGAIVSVGPLSPSDPLSLVLAREDVERLSLGPRRVPKVRDEFAMLGPVPRPNIDGTTLSFEEFQLRLSLRAALARDLLATDLFEIESVLETGRRKISVRSVLEFERSYILSRSLHHEVSVSWGDRLRDAMVDAGMTVVRLPRHPRVDLLKRSEVQAYLPLMRKLRHDWFCDYHRDYARRHSRSDARTER